MAEIEGKGLDYERYALNKLFRRLARRHHLRQILELPAKGEKAMPSIYSLPFGQTGCEVSLVNAEPGSKRVWHELGYPVTYLDCEDLTHTGIESRAFDLVWDFMVLAQHPDKASLLAEMTRLSRRYVMFIGVNRFNPGFFSHRLVHRVFDVPWSHGDVAFMNPFRVSRFFRDRGLRIVERGLVDTPPYPDSLGIRDMRLHRKNVDLNKIDWDSRTIHWMKTGDYPLKLKLFYFFEWLPLPFPIKMLYAHLFYVLAERQSSS